MITGPNFLIIGAQRCGTTSLYDALVTHEKIVPAARREIHYFSDNYYKGWRWYLSELQPGATDSSAGAGGRIFGESSPYYLFHPQSARRIQRSCPDVKLIVLLRNPVERAYSHYNHVVKRGFEILPFEEALHLERLRLLFEKEKLILFPDYVSLAYQVFSYVTRGVYIKQLRHWFRLFPRNQMLILKSEEMFAEPDKYLNKVTDFLDIEPLAAGVLPRSNQLTYAPMDENVRFRLRKFFRPHNDLLARELDWSSSWD